MLYGHGPVVGQLPKGVKFLIINDTTSKRSKSFRYIIRNNPICVLWRIDGSGILRLNRDKLVGNILLPQAIVNTVLRLTSIYHNSSELDRLRESIWFVRIMTLNWKLD